MPSPLTEFVEDIAGAGESPGLGSVESVEIVDEQTAGVVFENEDTFGTRVEMQTFADDAGVQLSDTQEIDGGDRAAVMAREDSFFDNATTPESDGKRIRPADIGREPDGEFTFPEDRTSPAPESPSRRGPNGRFVSDDIEPVDDIGRQDRTGLFDLF